MIPLTWVFWRHAPVHQSHIGAVVQAVQGLHRRNIAWLDGKPDNVLCSGEIDSPGLRVTICDFGSSYDFVDGKTSKARQA